jgi:hypothetical protein
MKFFQNIRRNEAGFGHPNILFWIIVLLGVGMATGLGAMQLMIKFGFSPALCLAGNLGVCALVLASPWLVSWWHEKRKASRPK